MESAAQGMNETHRPVGVSLLAFFYFFVSLSMLCYAVCVVVFRAPRTGYFPANTDDQIFWMGCEAVLGAAAGVGLWRRAEWGRRLAVARAGLGILFAWGMNSAGVMNGSTILQILIAATVIVYFFLPGIRRAFAASPGGALSSVGAEARFVGRKMSWALLILLLFSAGVQGTHFQTRHSWRSGTGLCAVGIDPDFIVPSVHYSCIGQVTYSFFCFFYEEGSGMCY